MASELPRMTPLNSFFHLSELYWGHFQLPNNHHLIVTAACQVLSIWWESNYIDGWWVTTLKVILVLWLVSLRYVLRNCIDHIASRLIITWCLNGGIGTLSVLYGRQLPKAYPRVELIHLTTCYKVLWVREKVRGQNACWFFVPANLRYIYVHLLTFSI